MPILLQADTLGGTSGRLEDASRMFTILGIVAAGLFFGYKGLTGWLIINLDLSIELTRCAQDRTTDWLTINLVIKKGVIDSLWLASISAIVYNVEGKTIATIEFPEIKKLLDDEGIIQWGTLRSDRRHLTLSPGETLQLGGLATVSGFTPVFVHAAVLGKRPLWHKYFQWRASAVSLPLPYTHRAAMKPTI